MGRNFPSYRSYLNQLLQDIKRVSRLLGDPELASALREIGELIANESGAIDFARDPKTMQILLVIAKILSMVRKLDGRNNCRC